MYKANLSLTSWTPEWWYEDNQECIFSVLAPFCDATELIRAELILKYDWTEGQTDVKFEIVI